MSAIKAKQKILVKETETQKAIEAEKLNILIDAGRGHLFSLHEREIIFRAMDSFAGRSKSLEEKEKEIERLNKTINGLLETGGSTLSVSQLAQKDSRIRELEEALREMSEDLKRMCDGYTGYGADTFRSFVEANRLLNNQKS